jgi:hypothetical protein
MKLIENPHPLLKNKEDTVEKLPTMYKWVIFVHESAVAHLGKKICGGWVNLGVKMKLQILFANRTTQIR